MKIREILGSLDNREWHIYGGLVLGGVGGWILSPTWTLIIIGTTLVCFGLFGALLDHAIARLQKTVSIFPSATLAPRMKADVSFRTKLGFLFVPLLTVSDLRIDHVGHENC